jgi:transcriptional regulator with XRE-family HTH domain
LSGQFAGRLNSFGSPRPAPLVSSQPDPAASSYAFRVVFSARLASTRSASRLTQAALARRLGVSRQLVSAWEQGAALPPVHLVADIAHALSADLAALLAAPVADTGDGEDDFTAALLRGALQELAAAGREQREPAPPGVVAQRVLHAREAPARGRPARRAAVAPPAPARRAAGPPPRRALPAAPADDAPAEAVGYARMGERPHMRERVSLALRADRRDETLWAARELARYWWLLDEFRTQVRARLPLPADAARALAHALSGFETDSPKGAKHTAALPSGWAASDAIPDAARHYLRRIAQLGAPAALVCVDTVARVQSTDLPAEDRTRLLLDLLGPDDGA